MIGENLKVPDKSRHLVVTTSAATIYTARFDLVLDEMFRVAKPGGEVYFRGLPEAMEKEKAMRVIRGFEARKGVKVLKNPDGVMEDAYWFAKPRG